MSGDNNVTVETSELDKFRKALAEEQQLRQRELLEIPEKEQVRLKIIEFRRAIARHLQPIVEEYLTVLGKLWFGYERRFSGPILQREAPTIPAFTVAHQFIVSEAVFWVAESNWREREVPIIATEDRTEFRPELFQQGYRCRAIMKHSSSFEFTSDGLDTHILINSYDTIDRETLYPVFEEAFVKGPFVLHSRWKNWDLPWSNTGDTQP